MLYICIFSNKFDLIQAICVSHIQPHELLTKTKFCTIAFERRERFEVEMIKISVILLIHNEKIIYFFAEQATLMAVLGLLI
jgi:hypothetical protein